ncbi:hypothetical protein LAZ40_07025 [Cereibacter sphaeroides]|uniref:hypothetical protein n=1 Tax=Cereibacter sphaeroides TaxID=1063 RepID=UPI001F46A936|nr:hypothetical protein [Cereibacter sphaeroides]MCE6958800.1 hypothetical protein [Cereibacter sphaeroides]MCE6973326.1 hypothetical protein [Cereibacter sphaeroides]
MGHDAAYLLSVPLADAARLLGTGRDAIRKTFRDLASTWHPDHCGDPRAAQVFAHVMKLRDAALRAAGNPSAPTERTREFKREDGSAFAMRILREHRIDTGELLVGPHSFAWLFEPEAADVAETEAARIAAFRFADAKMETEMRRFLPAVRRRIALAGGRTLLVQERGDDDVLLLDLLASFPPDASGIRIPAVHAAWIGSGLFHVACWLGWAGEVHGAIGPENVVVNSSTHEVRLLGGFGFGGRVGNRPAVLPGRTLDLLPRLGLAGAGFAATDDPELIRLTLREILGDPAGGQLLRGTVPAPLARFLALPAAASALDDYLAWQKVLEATWGQRRFAHLDRTAATLYS